MLRINEVIFLEKLTFIKNLIKSWLSQIILKTFLSIIKLKLIWLLGEEHFVNYTC